MGKGEGRVMGNGRCSMELETVRKGEEWRENDGRQCCITKIYRTVVKWHMIYVPLVKTCLVTPDMTAPLA